MSRRAALALAAALCLVSSATSWAAIITDSALPRTVRVHGASLVNERGRAVQLRGVNRSGFEYACVEGKRPGDGPVDDASVRAMTAWSVTVVRVPLNSTCWLGGAPAPVGSSGAAYRASVVDYVRRLQRHGLVVVLTLQWDAGGPAATRTGQLPLPDATRGPAFWSSVATTFRDDTRVLFELHSEPYAVSWPCWRDGCVVPRHQVPGRPATPAYRAAGMRTLLGAVRRTGARQPVVLPGLDWGNDLSQWATHAPVDPAGQLVASMHVYDRTRCADAGCWERSRLGLAGRAPLLVTEIGEHSCTSALSAQFWRWADARGVGYVGWTWNPWSCTAGPALVTDWAGTPTPYGAGWRTHLTAMARAGR